MSTNPQDLPRPYAKKRFYTHDDLKKHNSGRDCWVAYFGKVYDLTPLLASYNGELAGPIIQAAGTDISHWFDEATHEPRTHIDPETQIRCVYCPQGRYIHVPPRYPDSSWRTDFGTPWWRDRKYCIGDLTSKVRRIDVMNLLTRQVQALSVPAEETIDEVQQRYLAYNFHAKSYTWKRLGKPLDMTKTLAENGVPDEDTELDRLGIDPDDHVPVLHLYFNDDLTEA
mmetsp:Transcript_3223/g.4958  ORF Transcript_3223/g.4958 Transcript_3223/m.4958 type:complete len:226 (+) Transcript_3223:53-730(+)